MAVCFKEGLQVQHLDVDAPPQKCSSGSWCLIALASCCALCTYRPPQQGENHHLEQDTSEALFGSAVSTDHIKFSTNERGGTLDPVTSDLKDDILYCHHWAL